jgi:hypothetical protein
MPRQKTKKGRGWHGDSAGHAAAGRKGGLVSRKNRKNSDSDIQDQGNMSM